MSSINERRRPIAARQWRVAGQLTELAAPLLSPNQISVLSVVLALAAAAAILAPIQDDASGLWLMGAAVLVEGRMLCNLLDGMVAERTGRVSALGQLFNDVPDRVSDSLLLVAAGVALERERLGWFAALAAVGTAYVRVLGVSCGASAHFAGPAAKPTRMHALAAALLLDGLLRLGGRAGVALVPTLYFVAFGAALTCANRLRLIANDMQRAGGANAHASASASEQGAVERASEASDDAAIAVDEAGGAETFESRATANSISPFRMRQFASVEQNLLWAAAGAALAFTFAPLPFAPEPSAPADGDRFGADGTAHVRMVQFVCVLLTLASAISYFMPASPTRENIYQRLYSWWFMFAIFVVALATGSLNWLLMFVSYLAFKEYVSIVPMRKTDRRTLLYAYISIPIQYWLVRTRWYGFFAVFIPVFAFLAIAGRTSFRQTSTKNYLRAISTLYFGLIVSVYLLSHVACLMTFPDRVNGARGNAALVTFVIAMTELNDVAQYVWGKIFGGRFPTKIAPITSPNKTAVGLAGGVLTSALVSSVLAPAFTPFGQLEAAVICTLGALAGFLGDLCISAAKRDLGIKDSGSILPGHGGILDRVDSLAFTAPLFFHYLRAFYM